VAGATNRTRQADRMGQAPERVGLRGPLPAQWPHRDKSHFTRAGGVDFHWQEWGTGPTILLLHGTGASTHSFAALAPLLSEHAHVVALDLPGHGFSDTERNELFTLPGMARAIAAFLKHTHLNPTLVVGHSAGAAILIRLALDGAIHPSAIIALNGAIKPLYPFSHPLMSFMAKLLAANPFVPWFFSKQADANTIDKLLRDTGSHVPRESRQCYQTLLQSRAHVAAALRMMAHWDLETLIKDIPQLKTHLVLIVGENDKTIPPRSADAVARLVSHADIHHLPQLGHLAHEEAPEIIAPMILSLLPQAAQHKAHAL
jgi:magnesium chelatase accessory protein